MHNAKKYCDKKFFLIIVERILNRNPSLRWILSQKPNEFGKAYRVLPVTKHSYKQNVAENWIFSSLLILFAKNNKNIHIKFNIQKM